MESAEAPMRYIIHARVASVESKQRVVRTVKIGDDIIQDKLGLGWFVHFEGSYESLFFGYEEPNFTAGDTVKITFERISPDALTQRPPI